MSTSSTLPFDLDPASLALLVGGIVYGITRLVDWLLPQGRHFRFIERWSVEDEPDDDDDEYEWVEEEDDEK